jgi:uncharacterized protein YoxC
MTGVFAPIGEFLVQSGAAVRDTVIMKQPVADRSIVDAVGLIATSIIAIALAALAIIAIPLALHSRQVYRRLSQLIDRAQEEFAPIKRNINDITDNVNFITTSVRADVTKLSETLTAANERVEAAVGATEQRISEFNALLAVVQDEAEQLFVSTASTVRGVRTGAAAFRDPDGLDLAFDERDAADLADRDEIQEERDGDNRGTESTTPAAPAAPRVRPRQRSTRRA